MVPDVSDHDLMTFEEVADRLRVPVGTIRNWRVDGIGPNGAKIGRRVKFRRADVEAWIKEQFEPSVLPPQVLPPERAAAAARYFPWADIVEAVAMTVADTLGATLDEANTINDAVHDALPDAYDGYMDGVGSPSVWHRDAEAVAMKQLGEALAQHLRPLRKAREAARPGA
jgi:excisionase family DNA binding protein